MADLRCMCPDELNRLIERDACSIEFRHGAFMQSAGEGVDFAAGIDKPVCHLVVKRMQVLICIPLRLIADVGQCGLPRVLNDGWPENQWMCFLNNYLNVEPVRV